MPSNLKSSFVRTDIFYFTISEALVRDELDPLMCFCGEGEYPDGENMRWSSAMAARKQRGDMSLLTSFLVYPFIASGPQLIDRHWLPSG